MIKTLLLFSTLEALLFINPNLDLPLVNKHTFIEIICDFQITNLKLINRRIFKKCLVTFSFSKRGNQSKTLLFYENIFIIPIVSQC